MLFKSVCVQHMQSQTAKTCPLTSTWELAIGEKATVFRKGLMKKTYKIVPVICQTEKEFVETSQTVTSF